MMSNLDDVLVLYQNWEKSVTDIVHKNRVLKRKINESIEERDQSEDRVTSLKTQVSHLNATIKQLHDTLSNRCDFEDEYRIVKEQHEAIEEKHEEEKRALHARISELSGDLKQRATEHAAELSALEEKHQQQMKEVQMSHAQLLDAKDHEIQQFREKLERCKKEKDSELMRLQIDYEGRLSKLEAVNCKAKQNQHSANSTSTDIFRKKLQHIKVEHEKQLSELRSQLSYLQQSQVKHEASGVTRTQTIVSKVATSCSLSTKQLFRQTVGGANTSRLHLQKTTTYNANRPPGGQVKPLYCDGFETVKLLPQKRKRP